MKISELILALEQAKLKHGDLECVVRGYEGGVNNVVELDVCTIALDFYATSEYFGRHDRLYDWQDPTYSDYKKVKAVEIIGRRDYA